MRVLLVESTPGNGAAVAAWLATSGHETATCFDPPHDLICRGTERIEDCPLHRHADLAVLVRDLDSGARMLTEMGAVCALRHRVPLVELIEPDETAIATVLDGVCGVPPGYEQVVRDAVPEARAVTITRGPGRVHARLHLAEDVGDRLPMVVDRANRALRGYDPFVKVIDVAVDIDG
jgi:hypothetical protein